jgi:L-lysine 6-transaminase
MSKPLTKEQVKNIKPADVHSVLQRVLLVDGFPVVYDLDKSHGLYVYDAKTNQEYLDWYTMFASLPLSHNHPALQDPEFKQKLARVALHNPANSDMYTVEMAQFVATFERVAMPREFVHLFLVQGGALAVENALKTAFDWKVRRNIAAGQGERGNLVIHFKEAFHGRSGYTLSLTNTQDPKKYLYFPRFDWPRIENPKAKFPLVGENLKKTIDSETRALTHIKAILEAKGPDIAAIILEPIQGEGGDNHFRPEFWKGLRELSDQYSVLLIADEVQTGMGLTGKFWAYQHYGVTPDIVCFGKKTQVCGIMATKRVDEVKDNVFVVSSRINSTWGGNLVDMVRSQKFLEVIESENMVQNSATVGAYFLEKLQSLQQKYPQVITGARGKGLLVSFDTISPDQTGKITDAAYAKNVILLTCGAQTIRFRPTLDCSKKEVDNVVAVLDEIIGGLGKAKL